MLKPLIQKIIVAVNGSEHSLKASMYAIMYAKEYKCSLKAVYVVDSATLKQLELSKFFIPEEVERYQKNLTSDGERYLAYVKKLADDKKVKIETELRTGSVWAELIKSADEYEADLIMLGGKKSSSTSMGNSIKYDKVSSTNSEIIGSANCNVLVVKESDIEKMFKLA